ncbi:hypothetical protein Tco_0915783 [Tanacetum coccineum]
METKRQHSVDKYLRPTLSKRAKQGKIIPIQRGPLPPVVFREPNTEKLQPLPEVPGKGKEKVGEEQAAQVLLNLQTPKKKSSAQHDTESDEEMPSVGRSGNQDGGQAGSNPGTLDEGQAGSGPGTRDEGQAGPNPDTLDEGQAGSGPGFRPRHTDRAIRSEAHGCMQQADNEKYNQLDYEAGSMASVTIRQDTSITPPMNLR